MGRRKTTLLDTGPPHPTPVAVTASGLEAFPQRLLEADVGLKQWHEFGMEWKEHVGWISPMLATAVAFVTFYYGSHLPRESRLRKALITLFIIAFASAIVAGSLGAFINELEGPCLPLN
ncbi:MAG: hypothetical protein ACRDJG_12165 [Actinomycetota bacterium]